MPEVFDYCPEVEYASQDEMPAVVFEYAGQKRQQRATLQDLDRRVYAWPLRALDDERAAIEAFFRARKQTVESFYVLDPKDHPKTGVSLGVAGAAQTVFELPTAGENSRDYPVDDLTVTTVYADAVPAAVASIDTDARTFTLVDPPTPGATMTVDYHAYRLVRLRAPFEWAGLGPTYSEASPEFEEVVE